MTHPTENPKDRQPSDQTSEDAGPIKQVQRDGNSKRGQETNRGSETATGHASRRRG